MPVDLPANPFKAALARGERQLGLWTALCSPITTEVVAGSGFDWFVLDAEHAPLDLAQLVGLLQAAAAGGPAHPVVRPPANDVVAIKRVLDMGALTLLLPFVQSAAEAAAAVAAVRYPPHGVRGVAGTTRASRYGRVDAYLPRAAAELCVLVQVETAPALEQLAAIAATDGVDGVFIGPSDLAASMGHLGQTGHPRVQDAIRAAAAVIDAAGKAAGILAGTTQEAHRYLDWGYRFVACSSDLSVLARGLDALNAGLRAGPGI